VKTGFSGSENAPDNRFPRNEKLKGRDEIREVFNRGKGVSCNGAKLIWLRNNLPNNRIAFTFSRKFGNAVQRNHSRRLSREVYRQFRTDLRKSYDLVLVIYPGKDVFSVRIDQLRELFFRAGLMTSEVNAAAGHTRG
jgi:ribonuclease P protein component